ncbi:MAG: neutral/alkaline non-lysosomal ceramidase N-terminal domain-containing protein [Myxococcota bacterium]|jgi:hypothetical protein
MTSSRSLSAGVSRTVISPPPGVILIGYGEHGKGNAGVHDDLYATALSLSDGSKTVTIVSCDLLCMNEFTVDRIRSRVGAISEIIICCSHTHAGPVVYADQSSPRINRKYVDLLVEKVAWAVRAACTSAQPATLGWCKAQTDIAVNRREHTAGGKVIIGWNRDAEVDRTVGILQVMAVSGKRIATVVNAACHGTVLPPQNLFVSADWIGAMRRVVECETGAPVLFVQGAAGDLNPDYEWGRGDPWEAVADLGGRVARCVMEGLNNRVAPFEGAVKLARQALWLPLEMKATSRIPPKTYRHKVLEFAGLTRWLAPFVDYMLDRRYPWRSRVEMRNGVWCVPMRVTVLEIGELAFVAFGAEVLGAVGARVRALNPGGPVIFASVADGCIGYLPTVEAHDEGGYEVDVAPFFYRYPARLDRSCEELVSDAVVRMFRELS